MPGGGKPKKKARSTVAPGTGGNLNGGNNGQKNPGGEGGGKGGFPACPHCGRQNRAAADCRFKPSAAVATSTGMAPAAAAVFGQPVAEVPNAPSQAGELAGKSQGFLHYLRERDRTP